MHLSCLRLQLALQRTAQRQLKPVKSPNRPIEVQRMERQTSCVTSQLSRMLHVALLGCWCCLLRCRIPSSRVCSTW